MAVEQSFFSLDKGHFSTLCSVFALQLYHVSQIKNVEYGYFFTYKNALVPPSSDIFSESEKTKPSKDSGGAFRMNTSSGFSPISSHNAPWIMRLYKYSDQNTSVQSFICSCFCWIQTYHILSCSLVLPLSLFLYHSVNCWAKRAGLDASLPFEKEKQGLIISVFYTRQLWRKC